MERQTCCVSECSNKANYLVKTHLGSLIINLKMCGRCLQTSDLNLIEPIVSINKIESRATGMRVWRENEKWKCYSCGNEVMVTKSGGGILSCCDKGMEK
jgi:desulfoferrodoxin-like iron-binding protein